MSTPNHLSGGLDRKKYRIFKRRGDRYVPVDPDAHYFVLRMDRDRHALNAMRLYAHVIRGENKRLSDDLFDLIGRISGEEEGRGV